ncbi:MAG: HU family DNA-binding protein [Thiobacillus sp.]|nr:HU family DNA-binding protein [Thiobacillus sp.]
MSLARKTGEPYAQLHGSAARQVQKTFASRTLKKSNDPRHSRGSIEVRKRAARTGRNPETGKALKIKAAKVTAFKPDATLKDSVNGVKK